MEGIEVDVLNGKSELIFDIELSAPLGLADMDPVGGSVTGALEPVPLDKRFEENGGEGEALPPVVLDAAGGQGEEMGGEVFGSDPGEDEKAGIVDDEGISGSDLPSGGPEAKAGDGGFSGEGEVADLISGKGLVAEVVVALDEVVPEVLLAS